MPYNQQWYFYSCCLLSRQHSKLPCQLLEAEQSSIQPAIVTVEIAETPSIHATHADPAVRAQAPAQRAPIAIAAANPIPPELTR